MFHVRTATWADIAAIDALLARAYPRLLRPDYPPSVLVTALPRISRAQPRLVTSGTYFVVEAQEEEEEGGAILGAGGWTRDAPGGAAAHPGLGHIRHVVTDDRQVRRGIGRALMTHVIATARAAGLTRLDCLSTRTAVPFYAAMGFAALGPVTVPLGPGIDFPAVAMTRAI
ncbi:MAG: GNAT family N-acetyltransferase [Rhodobacterales bacterium]|nr:GNAT family N-acetyltransferase [Rhodobacterales bacterium]NCT13361.1 GNAT family N-acetyltransferase [Rhodobacterales bacterium]